MKKIVILTSVLTLLFVQPALASEPDFTIPEALSDTAEDVVDDVTGIISDTDEVVGVVNEAASALQAAGTATVTFNSDGGTKVNSQSVTIGSKATEPAAPTRTGYQFVEWTFGNAPYDFDTPVTKDIELKASWASRASSNYTIVYHAGDGNSGSRFDDDDGDDNDHYIKTVTAAANSSITKPADPLFTKELTFSYWTASPDGNYTDTTQPEFDFTQGVSHDMDIYAVYTVADNSSKYVTVTLHPNGGSLTDKSKIDVRSGYAMDEPSNPKRDGYQFLGWSDDKDIDNFTNEDKFDFDTAISIDMDLYAYWKEGADVEIAPGVTFANTANNAANTKPQAQPISLTPTTNTATEPTETYTEVVSANMPKTGVTPVTPLILTFVLIVSIIGLLLMKGDKHETH